MAKFKMPPKAKIYEALSAIADSRIIYHDSQSANVSSSNREKEYVLKWNSDFTKIYSNDNATLWQGYFGYPVIAILMDKGILNYHSKFLSYFSNIDWNKLNKEFKRDYDKAVYHVLEQNVGDDVVASQINEMVDTIFLELSQLSIEKLSNPNIP